MDNSVLVVGVLMVTVLLRVAIVIAAIWFLIPRRRWCPHCSEETAALESPRGLVLARVERRWCLACGWVGLSKRLGAGAHADLLPRSPAGRFS
ncbi:MAG TPA: hypothetical protein VNL18_12020 [Gemmatimonadales bacterium]|nr:hypothetical protein [Gemmatimonadales bacterium]